MKLEDRKVMGSAELLRRNPSEALGGVVEAKGVMGKCKYPLDGTVSTLCFRAESKKLKRYQEWACCTQLLCNSNTVPFAQFLLNYFICLYNTWPSAETNGSILLSYWKSMNLD